MAELFFSNMNILARSSASNTTADALQVFCGHPLSEPYQAMPRTVLYPLLWLAFWSRTALVIVMLWTSVAALHVVAFAKSHSYSTLDLDMFPAYTQALLGLLFAPALITLSRGLKKGWRVDVFVACLWMVLLWIAMCYNVTTSQPMRRGQSATLFTVPSHFWTGRGKTDPLVIFETVLVTLFVLFALWMASKGSLLEYARNQASKARTETETEGFAKVLVIAPKAAFWGFIFVVAFGEDAFKRFPPHEKNADISQWGPLVALALVVVGFVLRYLVTKFITDPTNSNKTKFQKDQNSAAMGVAGPQDTELKMRQPAAEAHVAKTRHEASKIRLDM